MENAIKSTQTTDGRERHFRVTSGGEVVREDCAYTNVYEAMSRAERSDRCERDEEGYAVFRVEPINHEGPIEFHSI